MLCLVAGGGAVAERKVGPLLDAGARVHVVAPEVTAPLRALAEAGKLDWSARPVAVADLDGCFLALACTDDRETNRQLAGEARQRGILVNVADAPEEGTVIAPALLERGDLQVAVWSGGGGPVVSQMARDAVAGTLGDEWGLLSKVVARCRAEINRQLLPAQRAAFWRGAIDDQLLSLLQTGNEAGAEARLRAAQRTFMAHHGTVDRS